MTTLQQLFSRAHIAQRNAIENTWEALLLGVATAAPIWKNEDLTPDARRDRVGQIATATAAKVDALQAEIDSAQEKLEQGLAQAFKVNVETDVRTYNATRAAAALQGAGTVEDLLSIYESPTVQDDPVLKEELEKAVQLHRFGKEAIWENTVKLHRPAPIRAAEQWRQKVTAFKHSAKTYADETLPELTAAPSNSFDVILGAFDKHAQDTQAYIGALEEQGGASIARREGVTL